MILFNLVITTRSRVEKVNARQQELMKALAEERERTAVMKRKHDMVQSVVVGLQEELKRKKT